jgi:glycogen(starch) synthase
MFEELHKTCEQIEEQIGRRLFRGAVNGRITSGDLLDEDDRVRLKKAIYAWHTGRQPPIVTHDLIDDASDPILQHIRHRGLFNSPDDPVKVVFHPQFITATGPLISLDYEQFVRGCHLGIFPSYYEPWGYTPMECAALGVPAVTTDLSGFGAYVQRHIPGHTERGIYVLNRRTHNFDQSVAELVEHLFEFVKLSRRQRIERRNSVERLSEMFDWPQLIAYYNEAHDMALQRGTAFRPGAVEVRML